ncbi:MAG: hypothetical protein HY042_13045 [Spirochaetia bacterium]|nr:hypothetical protein [Spirochaetia bacterium]
MKDRNMLLGAAVGGLLAATTILAQNPNKPADPSKETGKCYGVNTCKGKGECMSKDHSCGGQNSCAGKGWKKMTMKDCTAKKGRFEKGKTEM